MMVARLGQRSSKRNEEILGVAFSGRLPVHLRPIVTVKGDESEEPTSGLRGTLLYLWCCDAMSERESRSFCTKLKDK
jgi:hypothetical protein